MIKQLILVLFVFSVILSGCSSTQVADDDLGIEHVKKEGYNFSLIQAISVLDFVDFKDEINSGKIVAETFMKKLIKKDYDIIESTQLQTVLTAKDLGKPEDLDIDLFRKLSEIIRIDALLTGTVTDYTVIDLEIPDDPKRRKKMDYATTSATVGINARFVDIKSGSVIWMDSTVRNADTLEEALNEAVDDIITTFLNDLY